MNLLGKLLDPRGPIGNVIAPSETFKERAGLPIAATHAARVAVQAHERTPAVAITRFVAYGDEQPPVGRVRHVGQFSEEWRPVYATTDSTDVYAILAAAQQCIGWQVTRTVRSDVCDCTGTVKWDRDADGTLTHSACGRTRHVAAADFAQHVQSLQIQSSDAWATVYAPTIPGSDTTVVDGKAVTGGTQLRGRADYRRKTKGWMHWDQGVIAERAAADQRAKDTKKIDNRQAIAKLAAKLLPARGNLSPTERT